MEGAGLSADFAQYGTGYGESQVIMSIRVKALLVRHERSTSIV